MSTAAREVGTLRRARSVRGGEIRRTAARLFMQKGYEATTMRELALEVGIEAASLYNHVPSKQDLLAQILIETMEDLLAAVREAVDGAPQDPMQQIRAAIRSYVLFHERYLAETSITDSERPALEPAAHQRLLGMRDELSAIFKNVLRAGERAGVFRLRDLSLDTLFILSMIARLPAWYRPDGPRSLEDIADAFGDFILSALACGAEGLPRARPARTGKT